MAIALYRVDERLIHGQRITIRADDEESGADRFEDVVEPIRGLLNLTLEGQLLGDVADCGEHADELASDVEEL